MTSTCQIRLRGRSRRSHSYAFSPGPSEIVSLASGVHFGRKGSSCQELAVLEIRHFRWKRLPHNFLVHTLLQVPSRGLNAEEGAFEQRQAFFRSFPASCIPTASQLLYVLLYVQAVRLPRPAVMTCLHSSPSVRRHALRVFICSCMVGWAYYFHNWDLKGFCNVSCTIFSQICIPRNNS